MVQPDEGPCYTAIPSVVLREEFEDFFLLFDPETGDTAGLNALGARIYRLLDSARTPFQVAAILAAEIDEAPPTLVADVRQFLDTLEERGFVRRNPGP